MASVLVMGVVIVYLLAMLGIGYYYRELASTESGFLVADRRIGAFIGGGALAVTFISTSSLLGVTSLSYRVGILWGIFGGLGGVFSYFIAMYFIAPQLRDVEASTIPEFFEKQFGRKSHAISALVIALIMIVYLMAQITGGAHVAEFVFGVDFATGVLLVGGVLIIYTTLGGMYAVTITSFIQAVMLIGGVLIVGAASIINLGGWGAFMSQVQSEAPFYFTNTGRIGLQVALGFGGLIFLAGLCSPHIIFRYFASEDSEGARDTAAIAAAFQGVFFALIVIPPAAAILLTPGLENPDQAFLALTNTVLSNPILIGLIFAGILAAAMSTADAMLMNATSAIVHDLGGEYLADTSQERISLYTRIVTIAIGIIVVGLSISPPALILTLAVLALALFIGAFLGPVLIGIWVENRSDVAGALSMVIGIGTVVVTHPETPFIQLPHQTFSGILAALIGVIVFGIVNYIATSRLRTQETRTKG